MPISVLDNYESELKGTRDWFLLKARSSNLAKVQLCQAALVYAHRPSCWCSVNEAINTRSTECPGRLKEYTTLRNIQLHDYREYFRPWLKDQFNPKMENP